MTAVDNQPRPNDPESGPRRAGRRARSRMGELWITLVVGAFILLLLLIFILQNGQQAQVSFLGAHGSLPMGVALLLAAVFGVLLVALPGTARILQLRAVGRRSSVVPSTTGASADPAAAWDNEHGSQVHDRPPRTAEPRPANTSG